jgi:hypothetical protein
VKVNVAISITQLWRKELLLFFVTAGYSEVSYFVTVVAIFTGIKAARFMQLKFHVASN